MESLCKHLNAGERGVILAAHRRGSSLRLIGRVSGGIMAPPGLNWCGKPCFADMIHRLRVRRVGPGGGGGSDLGAVLLMDMMQLAPGMCPTTGQRQGLAPRLGSANAV